MKRKEVSAILQRLDVPNRFSLKRVYFDREYYQVLTVKDWEPCPKANEIKDAFRGHKIIVEFDY